MNYKGHRDKKFVCQECKNTFNFKGYSSQHKFCSKSCSKSYILRKKDELFLKRYNDWLNNLEIDVVRLRPLIRQFIIKRDGYKCKICGVNSWNGKPLTLWTDHIDGNASNNHPSNFRLVCPNCDSQSDTFGGKNRGHGRKSKGLPQYG